MNKVTITIEDNGEVYIDAGGADVAMSTALVSLDATKSRDSGFSTYTMTFQCAGEKTTIEVPEFVYNDAYSMIAKGVERNRSREQGSSSRRAGTRVACAAAILAGWCIHVCRGR